MSLIPEDVIKSSNIINGFTEAVVNPILANAYHSGNPPIYQGRQAVPTEMMDNLSNLNLIPNIGGANDIISASRIYNALVAIVSNLTRVGTFTFIWYYESSSGTYERGRMTGKVIFTTAYARTLASVNNGGVAADVVITPSVINALFSNLLNAWNSTSKYHHNGSFTTCHSNCYTDCYSDCYGNNGSTDPNNHSRYSCSGGPI